MVWPHTHTFALAHRWWFTWRRRSVTKSWGYFDYGSITCEGHPKQPLSLPRHILTSHQPHTDPRNRLSISRMTLSSLCKAVIRLEEARRDVWWQLSSFTPWSPAGPCKMWVLVLCVVQWCSAFLVAWWLVCSRLAGGPQGIIWLQCFAVL